MEEMKLDRKWGGGRGRADPVRPVSIYKVSENREREIGFKVG